MVFNEFFTRFKHYINVTNPSSLIYSTEQVKAAKESLTKENLSQAEFEFNTNLVNAAVHPVTGEVIPRLFRVSAIAPVNIPLIFAMLACPASNVPGTLFLHWLNQSYNTACNYANRSGSEQPLSDLVKPYLLAVSSACALAYGMGKVISTAGPLVPCLATAAANVSNIAFTRMDELTQGTPVFDEDGKVQDSIYLCLRHWT
jgi:hypothetical protein